ncbi:c-type cytochrome [Maricaulis salignorans]|uniref:Cytochrome c5 n=1 Tax=Maricaulis salignorans TaxID=144026 RepID=A0A1G9PFV1_9PROT|nr:c-type cytochrome [Maricaulis salignorans]SDL97696.1 Cytochrome c5 [Maricaulis salignorans]
MPASWINRVGPCAAVLLLLVMGACSRPDAMPAASTSVPPSAAITARAEMLVPPDAALAGIYDRSCRSCHAYVDSGAPLAGHGAEWDRRLAQGLDVLVEHTRSGLGAMPAMGMCLDCDDADFEDLIRFMATTNGNAGEAE